jgi:hypothetical protein
VKRSLDEVAADCLKLHLLLDMCARVASIAAPPTQPGTTTITTTAAVPGPLRFACGRGGNAGPSSDKGFVLDFSTVGQPALAAAYVAQRGGPTLRAASKLMLEVVQLLRAPSGAAAEEEGKEGEEEEEEEKEARIQRRLRAFYAPDFVGGDAAAAAAEAEAEAEAARERVVTELWVHFATSGRSRLEARLTRVSRALTGCGGMVTAGGGGAAGGELRSVFTLGDGGGDGPASR